MTTLNFRMWRRQQETILLYLPRTHGNPQIIKMEYVESPPEGTWHFKNVGNDTVRMDIIRHHL